jgi:hypothetical protein
MLSSLILLTYYEYIILGTMTMDASGILDVAASGDFKE